MQLQITSALARRRALSQTHSQSSSLSSSSFSSNAPILKITSPIRPGPAFAGSSLDNSTATLPADATLSISPIKLIGIDGPCTALRNGFDATPVKLSLSGPECIVTQSQVQREPETLPSDSAGQGGGRRLLRKRRGTVASRKDAHEHSEDHQASLSHDAPPALPRPTYDIMVEARWPKLSSLCDVGGIVDDIAGEGSVSVIEAFSPPSFSERPSASSARKRNNAKTSGASGPSKAPQKRIRIATEKRKAQNRSNQRAFRERRGKYMKRLEEEHEVVLELVEAQKAELAGLGQLVGQLEDELKQSRAREHLAPNLVPTAPPRKQPSWLTAGSAEETGQSVTVIPNLDLPPARRCATEVFSTSDSGYTHCDAAIPDRDWAGHRTTRKHDVHASNVINSAEAAAAPALAVVRSSDGGTGSNDLSAMARTEALQRARSSSAGMHKLKKEFMSDIGSPALAWGSPASTSSVPSATHETLDIISMPQTFPRPLALKPFSPLLMASSSSSSSAPVSDLKLNPFRNETSPLPAPAGFGGRPFLINDGFTIPFRIEHQQHSIFTAPYGMSELKSPSHSKSDYSLGFMSHADASPSCF